MLTRAEPKGGDGVGEVSIGAPEAEGADQSGRREDQVQKSGPKPCAHHQHNQRRLRAPVWASRSTFKRKSKVAFTVTMLYITKIISLPVLSIINIFFKKSFFSLLYSFK